MRFLKKIHANVWLGMFLIVFSIVFYLMAGNFINPEAATWPRLILIITAFLSVMLFLQGVRLTLKKADPEMPSLHRLKGPMSAVILILAYAVLMNYTGYFFSTAIFLPIAMFALGQRDWKILLGVTAGLELFIYVLFVVQLKLRMP